MGIKIEMSKDEISNLMNCISITQSEIEIIKQVDNIKYNIKTIKNASDFLNDKEVLNILYKKFLEKFKDY